MKNTLAAIQCIDWELLRTQKAWLLKMATAHPEADGIIHLMDAIQDAVVKDGHQSETTVFALLTNDGALTQNTYLEGQYRCKHCGSSEVSFQQSVGDAYCADCGLWQNDDTTPQSEAEI